MNTPNPLAGYLRKPEIYVKLPSGGQWWPAGSLNLPENNELPVMAMTGHDDLMMKNADGLINGSTGVDVIKSCCPDIIDPWHGPTMDIEYLFIAIRIASYGHEMELERSCSQCNETTKFGVDLRIVLDTIKIPDFEIPIIANDLSVILKPATYYLTNLTNQEVFEQQRAIVAAQSKDLLLEKKHEILKEVVRKLTDISVSKMIEYIDYILLPDGNRVTERTHLQQFIDQCDAKTFKALKKGIEKKNREYRVPELPFECVHCGHKETFEFEFDPGNFFGADS